MSTWDEEEDGMGWGSLVPEPGERKSKAIPTALSVHDKRHLRRNVRAFGPWRIDEDRRPGMSWNRHIIDSDDNAVCFMAHSDGKDLVGDLAKAHLITSAPNLLAALEACLNVMEQHEQLSGGASTIGDFARGVIAKAIGGSDESLTDAYAEGRKDEGERHKALRDAVEQILNAGHMNTEDLARLRAAWDNT